MVLHLENTREVAGKWYLELFVKLMEKPYNLKIVGVGLDNYRKTPRISPLIPATWIAGRVIVDEWHQFCPRVFVSMDENTQDYCINIEWRQISFSDELAENAYASVLTRQPGAITMFGLGIGSGEMRSSHFRRPNLSVTRI